MEKLGLLNGADSFLGTVDCGVQVPFYLESAASAVLRGWFSHSWP